MQPTEEEHLPHFRSSADERRNVDAVGQQRDWLLEPEPANVRHLSIRGRVEGSRPAERTLLQEVPERALRERPGLHRRRCKRAPGRQHVRYPKPGRHRIGIDARHCPHAVAVHEADVAPACRVVQPPSH